MRGTPSWTEQDQGKGSYVSIFDYSHGAVGDDFSLDSVEKFSFRNDHLLTGWTSVDRERRHVGTEEGPQGTDLTRFAPHHQPALRLK